jgi:transcription initiation factor TFIIE subunit alpha
MTLSKPLIEELVKNLAGSATVALADLIVENPGISEFTLADKLKIGINEVRNLIYRLQEHNLVYSTRKKDRQKGWYIYYWTFNMLHARDLLIEKKTKQIAVLDETKKEEIEGKLYACPSNCLRMSLEDAMEGNFKCPECEKVMIQEKDERDIKKIEEEMHRLRNEIHELKQFDFKVVDEEKEVKKKKKVTKSTTAKKVISKKVTKNVAKKIVKKVATKKNIKKRK